MTKVGEETFAAIRSGMANFQLSPRVVPNETIELERAFFPDGHRGVLDTRRQLVVGNRGMGKSFWTHALVNDELRDRLAVAYDLPSLARARVRIGFNGSEKLSSVAPTTDEIEQAFSAGHEPDLIWRAALLRAAYSVLDREKAKSFALTITELTEHPSRYAEVLSETDHILAKDGCHLTVVFDALDRLAPSWEKIRALTKALMVRVVGLQSFSNIGAKIFMRVDQFADAELFRFPDSSKLTNDRVDLTWRPHELYGLLLFELMRAEQSRGALEVLATETGTSSALPLDGRLNVAELLEQDFLITAIAGEFMGGHKKRGRVYTWVPLHLSDAANNCSPRTFLTAWKSAAGHLPPPKDKAVDHLGLIDGVRHASSTRLTELREDYSWIDTALEPLRRQFVPMAIEELFELWGKRDVVEQIVRDTTANKTLAPLDLFVDHSLGALLNAMTRIAVMEERSNGKINVPDIFRVEAQILRKGGVAVPRRA